MKKFFNSEELNIVQVSATTMAGKTLLQHAVFYDLDDHVRILLDGGYHYHYPANLSKKSFSLSKFFFATQDRCNVNWTTATGNWATGQLGNGEIDSDGDGGDSRQSQGSYCSGTVH